jgi:hypothetical protein
MTTYYGNSDFANAVVATPADLKVQLKRLEDLGADEAMLYCWSRSRNVGRCSLSRHLAVGR